MSSPCQRAKLYKREKLCSKQAIDSIFARDTDVAGLRSLLAFPLRVLWREVPAGEYGAPVPQFLISVPKKRLRHAVDRVRMRRLVREAWRLNRDRLPAEGRIQIVMIYVAPKLLPYHKVERAMVKIMDAITSSSVRTDEESGE
ncbi:MAG: ribonuclease P protein component [Candidatus Amulumruptor sp.]